VAVTEHGHDPAEGAPQALLDVDVLRRGQSADDRVHEG
jgi:hypothetical protein